MKDLVEIADEDFKNVNIWSIAAVLVIIALSFRSLSVPILLVASIEAAIAINMGIPYFIDDSLPFIASIVIGTIQLGATVDYSILMTTRYREERLALRSPKAAAQQALSLIHIFIQNIHKEGMTILLVEQNAQMALSVADRAYVLETGRVVMDGTGAELLTNERVRSAYLGG